MKKALHLALMLLLSAAALAADHKPVEETFLRYWSAYSKKDFTKAAADVLPTDLDAAKAALLPTFLGAQAHKDKQVQEIVNTFFGRAVGKARESLSPVEVFAGLNRIIVGNNPQMWDTLKEASTSIIFVRAPSADEAEVHFQVTHRGASDTDAESLTRKDGRWWLRLNENPEEVAAQFKAMFAGKPAN